MIDVHTTNYIDAFYPYYLFTLVILIAFVTFNF